MTALRYGGQSMSAPLRRVLVRPPHAHSGALWQEYGWRARPNVGVLAAEHDAFCAILADAGAEVVFGASSDSDPDAIYAYDPALVTNRGAILLRPGKAGRRGEVDLARGDLPANGVPIARELNGDALAEGGDALWLDESMLLVGRGYRTNAQGVDALAEALPGVDVVAFDLPHASGPTHVLHLMSLLSPIDRDLAVAYLPLMPVPLVHLLIERGIRLVEVPDEEFDTMGVNVLALAPRAVLALDGNRETRRRLERVGVDVSVYSGDELSLKGDGGPTCLTLPLLRDA